MDLLLKAIRSIRKEVDSNLIEIKKLEKEREKQVKELEKLLKRC